MVCRLRSQVSYFQSDFQDFLNMAFSYSATSVPEEARVKYKFHGLQTFSFPKNDCSTIIFSDSSYEKSFKQVIQPNLYFDLRKLQTVHFI